MTDTRTGIVGGDAALVPDDSYRGVVTALVTGARHHVLANLFIVDPDPMQDTDLVVDALLHDMAGALWRGVDSRLLIGGSRDNGRIRDACLLARARARDLGVPARLTAATEQRSDHAKIVVADDTVLLGSHNWSPGAFTDQTQDSVLIRDAALAGHFASRFASAWPLAKAEGFDVPI